MTTYYDVGLKEARLKELEKYPGFSFHRFELQCRPSLHDLFESEQPSSVVHLAAQAGVRYSLENPETYLDHNIGGTLSLLEVMRGSPAGHLLVASSSSVYGANDARPYKESDGMTFPLSPYAATKVAVEALTHSYAHLYSIPTTCFRFFTVYGPWGRPDMALYRFVDAIENGRPIELYGNGTASRDLTSVSDLAKAIDLLLDKPPKQGATEGPFDSLSPGAPWRTINIAGNRPVTIIDFLRAVENATGKVATINYLPHQAGDASSTQADTELLHALIGFTPTTSVDEICREFVSWYRSHAAVKSSSA